VSSSAALLAVAAVTVAVAAGSLGAASERSDSPTVANGQVTLADNAGQVDAMPRAARAVTAGAASITTAPTGRGHSARVVRIRRYADAPGSQRAIDSCRLVLWTTRPLWLAGHNYCGFQWLAHVRRGTVIRVTTGRAAGRFVVTGHRRLARQSGALPVVRADLVLQTCVGRGTGLTLARRLR
jgi:hypothetical protein